MFFVYYNTASDWYNGIGVVVKGDIEVRPIWDTRVERGLSEDIDGELCLFEEEAQELFWEGVADTY